MPRSEGYPWVRKHSVVAFYLLAFAISWLGYVPLIAGSLGITFFGSSMWNFCLVLPGCGPAVAAGLTQRLAGERPDGVLRLLASLRKRTSAAWYVLAALGPAALVSGANGVSDLLWPQRLPTLPPAPFASLLPLTLTSLAANPCEEIGWRGFALTRLMATFNAVQSSLIVGLLWGLWHIPLFLWRANPMSQLPFWPWFIAIVAESCILAWLYKRSRQSLAIAVVFHVAFNVSGALLGIHSYAALAAVEIAVALALIWRYGMVYGEAEQRKAI